MPNLAELLTRSCERHAERTALKLDDAVVTYARLDDGAARVAGLLRERGVQPGDRVGLMMPNVPYFAVAYYGILRAGGVVVPMNVLLKGREVAFYLGDPGAKVLFAWHQFADDARTGAQEAQAEAIVVKPGEFEQLLAEADPAEEVVARTPEDTAVILYTSGTTGKPKGAELTHGNLLASAEVVSRTLAYATEEDRVLGALPLFHSFGQTCALNVAIGAGASLHMIPASTPARRWRSWTASA